MTIRQLADLRVGPVLAAGGQGEVAELVDDPQTLFKRYHNPSDPQFQPYSLRLLVEERDKISFAGLPVDEWAAWPKAVVLDSGRAVGFLMRRVPDDFLLGLATGKPRLADLSFLAATPSPLWAKLALPTDQERVAILVQLAAAVRSLHQRKIVLGDISFLNVLWARIPRPRIMLLDCDGMRPEGRLPVLPQVETLDWNDPLAPVGTSSLDSDRYKLALAVLRVLGRSLDARPTPTFAPKLYGLSKPAAAMATELLHQAAGAVGSRPTAHDWVTLLSGRVTTPINRPLSNRRGPEGPPAKPDVLDPGGRQYRPVQRPNG